MLYLVAATSLAPALTTLLAAADRGHQVVIGQTADGVQVVLRHDCFHSPTERHGFIARVLTLVARPPAVGLDHVIQFTTSAQSEQASAAVITPVTHATASEFFLPADLHTHLTRLTAASAVETGHPPGAGSSLLNVRSIVLLI